MTRPEKTGGGSPDSGMDNWTTTGRKSARARVDQADQDGDNWEQEQSKQTKIRPRWGQLGQFKSQLTGIGTQQTNSFNCWQKSGNNCRKFREEEEFDDEG